VLAPGQSRRSQEPAARWSAGHRVPVRQYAVQDTWAIRELPVLNATVSLLEESYMVTVSDIAGRTGLEAPVVARSLEALDPAYLDFRKTETGGDPTFWYVLKVTPQARRAVGQWPTPDSFVTRLAEELSAAAAQEEDTERKGLLSYAARLIGDTLREAAVRAAGQVLAPSTDLPPSGLTPPAALPPRSALEPSRSALEPRPSAEPRSGAEPRPGGESQPGLEPLPGQDSPSGRDPLPALSLAADPDEEVRSTPQPESSS
jgi:hypothetical protein